MPLPSRVADLTGFDLLLSVAELGSIGRAARAHGMSQPSASERLRTLESRVGVPLLDRTPRGARLTTEGQLVAGWAAQVLERAADLDAGITSLRADRQSHLRVAASLTVAEYLLPAWLIALRAVSPDTATVLSAGNSVHVAEQVLADRADLGFIESTDVPAGLATRVVAHDELVLVVAPGHPWSRRRRVTAGKAAATPLVVREPGSGTRQAWEHALTAAGVGESAGPLLEMSSTTAIKAAAIGGIGPAVLSLHTVATDVAARTLVRVEVAGVNLHRALRAVWPAGRTPRGPAADLLAIATRSLTDRADRR
ncbi:LysR family transcriptional regulator [Lentzea jiangxiensis]|uniref:DNA-binding transcriptional regulator, LysR family n=1 Tax=Lentzea jiangxiensis TaxID=641025 RepID=A0A1H0J0B9_9PSEU|nr:LysR family transcriptional regulator [Lentzea jiangxiensis]SDO37184.1 DNA-binding transcriptional regulator, LysR family [Lentzea jiangxiensis]